MNTYSTAGEPVGTPATPVLLITGSGQLVTLVSAVTGPLRLPLTVTGSVHQAGHLMLASALVLIGADKLSTLTPPPPAVRPRLLVVAAGVDTDVLTLAGDVLGSVCVCWLPMAATWLTDQITAAIAPATGPCAERLPRSGSTTTQEGSQ